jgi:hypothetical protein
MSAKAKKVAPVKATKAAPAKAAAKSAAAEPKKSAKQSKAEALDAEATALLAKSAGAEDDAEEEEETKSAAASSGGGNAAALAAAVGSTEMSASFKNFRHHPDMENFYRFIYENDLRLEALAIINDMMVERANRKLVKSAKANAH